MSGTGRVISILAGGMAGGPDWGSISVETGSDRGLKPAGGKRRLIRGERLVAQISNDHEPQLPVVGEDIPGTAVSNYLGAVRSLRTVDQRAPVVGCGVRPPCSDLDESEDDALSVGRPLVTAAPHWVGQEDTTMT